MRICPECHTQTTQPLCPRDGFVTTYASILQSQEPERLVGTVFEDRYRIDGIIGRGGMGTVYRGTQLEIDRPVAIKVLSAARTRRSASIQRFRAEAQIIARLSHPNIIRLIDYGAQLPRHLYLVMELVEGRSLGDLDPPGRPLAPSRIVHIVAQILGALDEAHRNGIVHRDLKPTNVMVTRLGDRTDFVKILDFGVACEAEPGVDLHNEEAGLAIGSPMYMAPEQAAGRAVTGQADLYALGVMSYELLTGRPPFRCATSQAYLSAHVHSTVPPPLVDGMELAGPLVDFVMRCLQKRPERRPAGARAALEALMAAADEPLETRATDSVVDVTAVAVVDSARGTAAAATQDATDKDSATPESVAAIAWPWDDTDGPNTVQDSSPELSVLAPQRNRMRFVTWVVGASAVTGLVVAVLAWL